MSPDPSAFQPMIRLRTLGRVEAAAADGTLLPELSRQSKLIALLSYLAVEGPGWSMPVESVCDLFWPDADLPRARRALSQLLHTGRQSFGIEAVERVRGGRLALISGALTCDAGELLHGAVDAEWVERNYLGEFLPGLQLAGADEFNDWLDRARTRLRMAAVERLLSESADTADEASLRLARRALELDPYCEVAAIRTVEALGTLRGRADAWRFFEEFRTRFRNDLDLDPPPALTRCVMRVCSDDAALAGLPGRAYATSSDHDAGAVTLPVDAALPVAARRSRKPHAFAGVASAAVVMLLLAAVLMRLPRDLAQAGTDAGPADLVIAHPAGDPLWRTIIAPELAERLSDHGLRIVRGADASARAPFILRGDVRAEADDVSGFVQLVGTGSNALAGSWRIDVARRDLPARLASVGDSVRRALGSAAAVQAIRSSGRSATAVAALLRARTHLETAATAAQRGAGAVTASQLQIADSLALVAIAADSRWAQPHLLRAELLERRALQALGRGDQELAQQRIGESLEAADRAVALEGSTAALERRGGLYYLAWALGAPLERDALDAAAADLGQAVRDDGAGAHTWAMLSGLHHAAGRIADADAAAREALAVDVFGRHTENILLRLFHASFDGGRGDDARRWCDELQRRSPGRWHAVECELGTLAWTGADGAAQLAGVDMTLSGEPAAMAAAMRPRLELVRAAAFASNGEHARAVALMDSVLTHAPADSELPYFAAMVHAQLGRLDSARGLLDEYIAAGPPARRAVVHARWFRPLHEASGSAGAFALSFSVYPRSTTRPR